MRSERESRREIGTLTYYVARYLEGQGWQLVDAAQMATVIWQELDGPRLEGDEALRSVETAVWERYGALLHEQCRQRQAPGHERAWQELRLWLGRQVGRVERDGQEQEDILQDALVALQGRLQESPLDRPRAFLAYALQVLRRTSIDRHRRQTAAKRGRHLTLSLEEVDNKGQVRAVWRWHEAQAARDGTKRRTERNVTQSETRRQLTAFFREQLPSELQQQVAMAHFVDDLAPAEIAGLMGKKPHEIRMAKARAVQRLRRLTPDAQRKLLDILDAREREDANDE